MTPSSSAVEHRGEPVVEIRPDAPKRGWRRRPTDAITADPPLPIDQVVAHTPEPIVALVPEPVVALAVEQAFALAPEAAAEPAVGLAPEPAVEPAPIVSRGWRRIRAAKVERPAESPPPLAFEPDPAPLTEDIEGALAAVFREPKPVEPIVEIVTPVRVVTVAPPVAPPAARPAPIVTSGRGQNALWKDRVFNSAQQSVETVTWPPRRRPAAPSAYRAAEPIAEPG